MPPIDDLDGALVRRSALFAVGRGRIGKNRRRIDAPDRSEHVGTEAPQAACDEARARSAGPRHGPGHRTIVAGVDKETEGQAVHHRELQ